MTQVDVTDDGAALGGDRSFPAKIRKLPPLLVNQIAAGEVVERPASVVKELLDNALDAGATRITVELEGGGIELVRITDDGAGIPAADLPLAVAPHATSKISAAADLDRIGTMGFRGEALASIASVSRLSIRSRRAEDAGASLIEAEGDLIADVRPAPGPIGTCVTIRNLFFNTPARRKFLRTPTTEQGHCLDIVEQLAMSHPAVGFTAACDGRTVIELPPNQSPRERLLGILGRELEPQLVEVHADRFDDARGLALWGMAGLPGLARATAKAQHIFLNGRPIRDKSIQHALREAYRGLIEPGRYPTAVVMLEMDPGAVDVNVHPQKLEVRFRDQSMVHSVVLRAVRDALRSADLTPGVGGVGGEGNTQWAPGNRGSAALGIVGSGLGPGGAGVPPAVGGAAGVGTSQRAPSASSGNPAAAAAGPSGTGAFVDYFSRVVPGQAGGRLSYEAIRDAVAQVAPTVGGSGAAPNPPGAPFAAAPTDTPPLTQPRPAERVLQIHNSYVVTEDEHGIVIVDQHALHERVMFEELLARVMGGRSAAVTTDPSSAGTDAAAARPGEGGLESQRMLVPPIVEATRSQMDRLTDKAGLASLLSRLGIELQPIGPTSLAVQAFPTFLFDRGVDPAPFIRELLEKTDGDGFTPNSEAALHEVLDMMACKAAVKAGEHMGEAELRDLLKLRTAIERSSNCPHGRPTSIRMTIRELERRFGRS